MRVGRSPRHLDVDEILGDRDAVALVARYQGAMTVPTAPIAKKLRRLEAGEAPRVVDLFSGCGGMSLGFQAAGYEILAGIELEPVRARTHARNFHAHLGHAVEAVHGQARDVTQDEPHRVLLPLVGTPTPQVDVLVGGPPCQAYARVGRAKLREIAQHPDAYRNDPRGQLYAAYIRWVEALQPVAVVMENVPDILSYGGDNVAETIAESLDLLGYEARYTLLNAAFYGVPQTRERWYLLAIHRSLGRVPVFPAPVRHTDLPRGYVGTRSHALGWETMAEAQRPKHAQLLSAPGAALPRATSCRDALSDLPHVPEAMKARRGARDLSERLAYRSVPTTAFQELMRTWGGRESPKDVTAQVVRHLPRDWETFRRMPEGAYYPAAWAVAWTRFEESIAALARQGRAPLPESPAWINLRDEIVPPYDRTKFPNKWWKLQADLPSRTLMAHLSHDSYSHIHYDPVEARTISVREAARLQSFPDHFEFCGAMNAAFGQVGNAVPPLMARALAEGLAEQIGANHAGSAPVRTSTVRPSNTEAQCATSS